MAEVIQDGLGSGNKVAVDSNNRLWTNVSGTVAISGTIHNMSLSYKQLIDYQGKYQPVYIGLAIPSAGSETASWMIRKYIYEGDLNVATLFASGNTNFDKKWSERSGTNEAYS